MNHFEQEFFPVKNAPEVTDEKSTPVKFVEADTTLFYDNPVDAYLETLGSKQSKRVMRSMIQQFTNLFQKNERDAEVPAQMMNWSVINRQAVLFAINQRKSAGASLSGMRLMLSAIRGVAREAWLMKLIRTDTYQRIKEVKAPKGSTLAAGRAVPMPQLNALLETCRGDASPTGARDLAMLSILMVCGLRRSELVSIDIAHLDREEAAIRITGKGNKQRMVYLDQDAMADVSQWIDEYLPHDAGPMFTRIRSGGDVTSSRLTDQAVRYILEQRCLKAGIEQIVRPHDMRRSFATHMLETIDPLTVQDMLGHSSVETTKKYDRRGEKRKKEAVAGFRETKVRV